MRLRTTTTPNGSEGGRVTAWGWDAVAAVSAILLAIGGAWVSMNRDQAATQRELEGVRDSLPAMIATTVAEVDAKSAFLRREEYMNDQARQDAALRAALESIAVQLSLIADRQGHNLSLLEKLPTAKEKTQ